MRRQSLDALIFRARMLYALIALVGCSENLDLGKDVIDSGTHGAKLDGAPNDASDVPGAAGGEGGSVGAGAAKGAQSRVHVDCTAWDASESPMSGPCPARVDWATVLLQDAPEYWDYLTSASDALGNLFVLSRSAGKVALIDREVGVDGTDGSLLVSYTPAGDVRWAQQIANTGAVEALAMAGSHVCVFLEYNRAEMLPNEIDRQVRNDGLEYGVTCFDLSGNALWSRRLSADLVADVRMAGDSQGNLYVEGIFSGELEAAPGVTATEHEHDPGATVGDVFLAGYDANGAPRFLRSFGSAEGEEGGGVVVTSDDAVAITGKFLHTIDIDGTELNASGAFFGAAFLARLDTDGNVQWAVRVGEDVFILTRALASGPDGSVAVALSPGDQTTQLFRYDTHGTLVANRTESWLLPPALARIAGGYVEAGGCSSADGHGPHRLCIEQLDDDFMPRSGAAYAFDQAYFDTQQVPTVTTLSPSGAGLLIGVLGAPSEAQLLLHVQL